MAKTEAPPKPATPKEGDNVILESLGYRGKIEQLVRGGKTARVVGQTGKVVIEGGIVSDGSFDASVGVADLIQTDQGWLLPGVVKPPKEG